MTERRPCHFDSNKVFSRMRVYLEDHIVISICLTSILCLMDQNFSPTHYLLPVFEYSPYLKLKDLKKESRGQKMGEN